jgi:hypothetical protein
LITTTVSRLLGENFTAWVFSMWRYGHRPAGQQSLRSRSRRDLAFLVFLSLSTGPEERASCPCRYVDTRLRLRLCREWSSYQASGDDRDDESQKGTPAHLYPPGPCLIHILPRPPTLAFLDPERPFLCYCTSADQDLVFVIVKGVLLVGRVHPLLDPARRFLRRFVTTST